MTFLRHVRGASEVSPQGYPAIAAAMPAGGPGSRAGRTANADGRNPAGKSGEAGRRKYTAQRTVREEGNMADEPSRGLADVVAASTALSDIDGQAGRLFYRGYDINDLAGHASFEEVAFLLQRGHAPSRGELDGYRAELAAGRRLGSLAAARPGRRSRAASGRWRRCAALSRWAAPTTPTPRPTSPAANLRKAARLTAQQPVLIAAYHAARTGRDLPPADPEPWHRRQLPAAAVRRTAGHRAPRRSSTPAWCCTPITR